jgi:hypothetical protein
LSEQPRRSEPDHEHRVGGFDGFLSGRRPRRADSGVVNALTHPLIHDKIHPGKKRLFAAGEAGAEAFMFFGSLLQLANDFPQADRLTFSFSFPTWIPPILLCLFAELLAERFSSILKIVRGRDRWFHRPGSLFLTVSLVKGDCFSLAQKTLDQPIRVILIEGEPMGDSHILKQGTRQHRCLRGQLQPQ